MIARREPLAAHPPIAEPPLPTLRRRRQPGTATSPLQASMALTLDDVRRIAELARIEVNDREVHDVHAKLGSIFGLIDALQAIDTTGIAPMSHALDVTAPLRDDVVSEPDQRETFQRVAPAVEDWLYLVPRVVE